MTTHPANWYPDPEAPQHRLRYWNGVAWTTHTVEPQRPQAPVAAAPALRAGYQRYGVVGALGLALIGLITVLDVVAIPLVGPAFRSFEDAARRGEDPSLVWTAYDTVSLVAAAAMVPAWILTATWLFGVRRNAELIAPGAPHRRGSGWAWGGWICPVVNLWFPYQVVKDVVRASGRTGALPVGWWWAAFLVFTLASRLGPEVWIRADTDAATIHDGASVTLVLQVLAALGAIAAAVLWFVVVRGVNRAQGSAADAA